MRVESERNKLYKKKKNGLKVKKEITGSQNNKMEKTYLMDYQVRIYQVHFQIDYILTLLEKEQHHLLANQDIE